MYCMVNFDLFSIHMSDNNQLGYLQRVFVNDWDYAKDATRYAYSLLRSE